jgi:hypothetical protein
MAPVGCTMAVTDRMSRMSELAPWHGSAAELHTEDS